MTLNEVKAEIGRLSREDRAALRPWLLEHFDAANYSGRGSPPSASRAPIVALCGIVGVVIASIYLMTKGGETDRSEDATSETARKQREAEAWDQEDDELV